MGVRKKRDPLAKKGRRVMRRIRPLAGGCYTVAEGITAFTQPLTKKQQQAFDAGYNEGHARGMQAGLIAGEQSAKAKMEKDHQESLMKIQRDFLSAAGQSMDAIAHVLGEAACFGRR